jgi:hypothetical protein
MLIGPQVTVRDVYRVTVCKSAQYLVLGPPWSHQFDRWSHTTHQMQHLPGMQSFKKQYRYCVETREKEWIGVRCKHRWTDSWWSMEKSIFWISTCTSVSRRLRYLKGSKMVMRQIAISLQPKLEFKQNHDWKFQGVLATAPSKAWPSFLVVVNW